MTTSLNYNPDIAYVLDVLFSGFRTTIISLVCLRQMLWLKWLCAWRDVNWQWIQFMESLCECWAIDLTAWGRWESAYENGAHSFSFTQLSRVKLASERQVLQRITSWLWLVIVLMVVLSMPANMAWMKTLMLHLDFDLVIVLVINSHRYRVWF